MEEYGTESITNLGTKMWTLVLQNIKEIKSLSTLKARLRS